MTPPPPLVSVVIPTYNRPDLLAEALDSVLAQTMGDVEVVVIDDGSTDDTPARLADCAARDGRVRVIRQPNGGIGAARNRGIDESRGRYVALLDHDDWWLPDKLRVQVDFMASNPDCVACAVPYATSAAPDAAVVDPREVTDARGVVTRPLMRLARGQVFLGTSALMFDRARCRGVRYGEARDAIEDVQFQLGLVSRGPIGIAAGEGGRVLAVWRLHAGNFSGRDSYYYNGIKQLRRLPPDAGLGRMGAQDAADGRAYLAHCGRICAVKQLLAGRRARGLELYAREFLPQLRDGRVRFLLSFPALAAMPTSAVRRCVGQV